jgi:hypothetical protein
MADILIGGLVLLAAVLAAGKIIKDKRAGQSACAGCSGCAHQRSCPGSQGQPHANQ